MKNEVKFLKFRDVEDHAKKYLIEKFLGIQADDLIYYEDVPFNKEDWRDYYAVTWISPAEVEAISPADSSMCCLPIDEHMEAALEKVEGNYTFWRKGEDEKSKTFRKVSAGMARLYKSALGNLYIRLEENHEADESTVGWLHGIEDTAMRVLADFGVKDEVCSHIVMGWYIEKYRDLFGETPKDFKFAARHEIFNQKIKEKK